MLCRCSPFPALTPWPQALFADRGDRNMLDNYLKKILRSRVYEIASETPLEAAPLLSTRLDNHIWLKREDLQPVFSFKIRGAYNKLAQLPSTELERGVLAVSAGNHAQGVALSAQKLQISAVIVMPKSTPRIKVDSVRRYDAEIVLHGSTFDEAKVYAETIARERGLTVIPPFDDPDVIAGQGTVGLEILRQHPGPIDAVFVPVGGGGLIAGIAAYIKAVEPDIRVIGVEPDDSACMHAALAARKRVVLDQVGIFADGVAVRQVGEEPFRIAQLCVDEVITVSTDEICAAIKDIYDETRSIAEPAGALGVAGVKRCIASEGLKDSHLIVVDSGANVNFDRLRHIAERAELGEHREAILAVTIPERPGSFRKFCHALGPRSVTEFNYRYASDTLAHVFVGVELRGGRKEKSALVENLKRKGYPVLDITDNETAKLHLRYMVGGHAPGLENEVLFRFEFPERPGALLRFLTGMGKRWNISLFHYRNHGSAFGRVLIGIQVPVEERPQFDSFLAEIGYDNQEETDNPIYAMFLN